MKISFSQNPQRIYEEDDKTTVLENIQDQKKLVLHNDDFNTFDFVIEALIEVCQHTLEQAQQCTFLVHYKGKCVVKTASMDALKPMHKQLLSKGLSSEIV